MGLALKTARVASVLPSPFPSSPVSRDLSSVAAGHATAVGRDPGHTKQQRPPICRRIVATPSEWWAPARARRLHPPLGCRPRPMPQTWHVRVTPQVRRMGLVTAVRQHQLALAHPARRTLLSAPIHSHPRWRTSAAGRPEELDADSDDAA